LCFILGSPIIVSWTPLWSPSFVSPGDIQMNTKGHLVATQEGTKDSLGSLVSSRTSGLIIGLASLHVPWPCDCPIPGGWTRVN
jgi:hypothetical protein